MRKDNIRDLQLTKIIADELDYAFSTANDSRLRNLVITHIEPKGSAGHFVVYVAPSDSEVQFQSKKDCKLFLNKAVGFLRSELSMSLNLKKVPELTILPDPACRFDRFG